MTIRLQLLLLLIPLIGSSQSLIKCNDTTSFFINQKGNFYCYIKLTGKVTETGNSRVIAINNYALQTLLINKQDYASKGKDDIPILTNYMISESQYLSGIYKERLNLMMVPVELTKEKKAVIWYFDIPEKFQKQVRPGEIPAVKQVSISVVIGDFVYSIGTTQFKDQSFEDLKKLLSDIIMTIKFHSGQLDQNGLCKNKNSAQHTI